jgi:hypothetical protein
MVKKKLSIMEKKNKLISKVSWTLLTNPVDAIMYENKNYDDELPISQEILNIKLRGKRIALLYSHGEPLLTTPFIGNTFGQWMECLYQGLNKTFIVKDLSREEIEAIYGCFGCWFYTEDRLKLVKKFETNKLKPYELLGNHIFFEGNLKLEKGTWCYSLGS